MATLRDISLRITGVKNTAKITQAMRMVSVAKLRRAQNNIVSARPYFTQMDKILVNLVDSVGEGYSHPLIQKRKEVKNICCIVIAADKGLCGSFNNGLFRYVSQFVEENIMVEHPDANIQYISVGKKSVANFRKINAKIIKEYEHVFQDLDFDIVRQINTIVKRRFINGDIDKVYLFFNEFKNLLKQPPTYHVLLPIEAQPDKPSEDDEDEKKAVASVESFANIDYIFEPGQKEILDDLLPKNLDIQLWRALLESNAAEQAARMMAMENATTNAKDLIRHLEMVFNKKRQEAITTEMLEIVSGANALGKSS
jgi:F-type H+-transporting ATPase subunit gamma